MEYLSNPLLDFTELPRFALLKAAHVTPAVDQVLKAAEEALAAVTLSDQLPCWESVVAPLEGALERISRVWGTVGHLNAVAHQADMRAAYEDNLTRVTGFYTRLGQDQRLFERYQALRSSAAFEGLSATQRHFIDQELRDFRLSGAELPEPEKKELAEIQQRLAQLSHAFSNHVLDATDAFVRYIDDPVALKGVPEETLQQLSKAAEAEGRSGYKLTLQMPCYLPLMQYCENRELRAALYQAHATRASEFGPAEFDNTAIMAEILALRQTEARLLGFESFAALSVETKMAETVEEIVEFLRQLNARARPYAQRDVEALRHFAKSVGFSDLALSDIAFFSEKLRQQCYDFSEQVVKRYLPEHAVLSGLFGLIEKLYGITVHLADAEVWHPSVRFYRLQDAHGERVGGFYLDLYARAGKRSGAWMDDALTRHQVGNRVQTPVAYLVCNFDAPASDAPACFSFDDTLTLFHEFGHGLHHLLTRVEVRALAGIHGIEWDAVELPSQFMENFCWEWTVFESMTSETQTGERIPRALFDKVVAARHFQTGMQTVRQVEFGLFDLLLHHPQLRNPNDSVQQVLEKVRQEIAVLDVPAYQRFPNSFSHIFSGGYAAGYYSYKWAEVLSADVFAAFEEEGVFNPKTGRRFLDEILAVGGSRPAMASFRAFRGRAPQIEALLRHHGMSNDLDSEVAL